VWARVSGDTTLELCQPARDRGQGTWRVVKVLNAKLDLIHEHALPP